MDYGEEVVEETVVVEEFVRHSQHKASWLFSPLVVISASDESGYDGGRILGHANGEICACDSFGGGGEVWRFKATYDGTPKYFIEGYGGESHLRFSHAFNNLSLSDVAGGGEMWCIIDHENNTIQIKGCAGEKDFFLGHQDGIACMIHRSEVNPGNSYWKVTPHDE